MPTVPFDPGVDLSANPMGRFTAPDVAAPAIQQGPNYAGKQIEQMGAAVINAATAAKVIAERLQDNIDDAAIKDSDIELSKFAENLLLNKDNGYLKKQRKDAVDTYNVTVDELNNKVKSITEGLSNKTQKDMFERVAARRVNTYMTQIDAHAADQTYAWNKSSTLARMDNGKTGMVLSSMYYDGKDSSGRANSAFTDAMTTTIIEAHNYAKMEGFDKEATELYVNKQLAEAHFNSVAKLIADKNLTGAKSYLSKFEQQIVVGAPDKIDALKNLINNANQTDNEIKVYRELSMMKGGLKEQIAVLNEAVDKNKPIAGVTDISAIYKNVKIQLEHDQEKIRVEGERAIAGILGQAQTFALKNPGVTLLQWRASHLNQYAALESKGQIASLAAFFEREGKAGDKITELTTRGKLLDQAMNNPDAFIQEFRESQFTKRMDLGATGIKEMQNIAADMINNNGKWKTSFDQKILQDGIPKALLEQGKKDQKDAFVAIMAEKTSAWQKDNPGKTPTNADYQNVIKSANEDWVSIGSMWNSDTKAYKVRATSDTKAVPKWFYDQGKQQGKTDSQILTAWGVYKQQQGQ